LRGVAFPRLNFVTLRTRFAACLQHIRGLRVSIS
jgi:hypothetical protein